MTLQLGWHEGETRLIRVGVRTSYHPVSGGHTTCTLGQQTLGAEAAQQRLTGLLTTAAAFCAHTAVGHPHVPGVRFTFFCTGAAGTQACLELRPHELMVSLTRCREHTGCGVADRRTLRVQADTACEVMQMLILTETSVGT